MRIVIVTSSTNRSGGTRQAIYQAQGLLERGHDVTLALPEDSTFWDLHPAPFWHPLPNDSTGWRKGMERLLFPHGRTRTHAIVHAFHNRAVKRVALWGLFWKRYGVVCVAHRGVLYRPGNPLPYLSPAMRAIIANSRACAGAIAFCTPAGKIRVVANAVPDERITPMIPPETMYRNLGLTPGQRCLVYVGNNSRIKGAEELMRAFAAADLPVGIHLIMLGVDPPRWQGLCAQLGLEGRILFPGKVENVGDYLQLAEAFVFPTNMDSAPNTLLEAVRMGLPVLATSVGGVPEIVDGNGLLVPPGDPAALATALREMTASTERRVQWSRRSRELGAIYTVEARCKALEAIYHSLE